MGYRRALKIALGLITTLFLINFLVSIFIQPILPSEFNSILLLTVASLLGAMMFLAYLNNILEFARKVFGKQVEPGNEQFEKAFEDYIRAITNYCEEFPYLSIGNLIEGKKRSLSEIYVPLKARTRGGGITQDVSTSIESVLANTYYTGNTSSILFLGLPGAGKSTLLRQVGKQAWFSPHKIGLDKPHIPMIVRLKALSVTDGASIETRFMNTLHKAGDLTLLQDPPKGFFQQWSQQNNANWMFLLDGWDEIPDDKRQQTSRWLTQLLDYSDRGNHIFVMTTRPTTRVDQALESRLDVYELLPFSQNQQLQFAKRWFDDKASDFIKAIDEARLTPLGGTPLLLTIAAAVFVKDLHLPYRRFDLYDRFVNVWLDEAMDRGLRTELKGTLVDMVNLGLEQLALKMTVKPEAIQHDDLVIVISNFLKDALEYPNEQARASAHKFIEALGKHSGLLLSQGNSFQWIHPTFREFLVARKLGRDIENGIHKNLGRYFWPYEISVFLREALEEVDAVPIMNIVQSGDSNFIAKFQAVVLIGQLRIEQGKEILKGLASQPDLDYRLVREVYISLATLGEEDAAFKYVELCKHEPEHAKRNREYTLYYFYDTDEATKSLIRHLHDENYQNRKIHDIYTLGQVGDVQALPHLAEIARDPDTDPRIVNESITAINAIKHRNKESS